MAFHHVALATHDLEATHRFYTEVMGFELAKVVAGPTPEGGWAKHVFYTTGGGGMIAFWELHVDELRDFPTDLNKSIGLPDWVNHVAFDAPTIDALDEHRRRWQEHGRSVLELDHGFCTSIYTNDPNGILVEFCCTKRDFTPEERRRASEQVLTSSIPPQDFDEAPAAVAHEPVTVAPA
jgi:catechol 2,3-dioxygenase-like lactoylglutathione lyase family enzyme